MQQECGSLQNGEEKKGTLKREVCKELIASKIKEARRKAHWIQKSILMLLAKVMML